MRNRDKRKKFFSRFGIFVIIAVLGLCFLNVMPVIALGELEGYYSYYTDDDLLTVNTITGRGSLDLLTGTSLSVKYTYETFEKDPPENAMDAVTGATSVSGGSGGGFEEIRREIIVGITQRFGPNVFGASYFYGKEPDYTSNALSLSASREFFEKNLTLSLQYDHSFDLIDPVLQDKDTDNLTFVATQILSPKLVASGGYSFAYVNGYQSSPLRQISIPTSSPGVNILYPENHPSERNRNTVFLRFLRYFETRTSADLNLSYYFDDWEIEAISTEFRLNQYLTKFLLGRLRYRFYSQTASSFYQPVYSQREPLMTADPRLREFENQTYGVKFVLLFEGLGLSSIGDWSLSAVYDRYVATNDGVKAHIGQAHLNIPF